MASDPDDLGDARSREENRKYRGMAERTKSAHPLYAYAPRWVPTGNWRMTGFDLLVVVCGIALILMVLGMRLFGVIG
ncbi:hypothetical protein SAMN02745194_04684 [Roseomonas rosea]|uniref:Uncharacterized protein n=1 Tax=Muricoccus roseus TaxID=198092 RepID=A0A1M6RH56_9PROT|nr:hypothetical protein [Roseomonas rosea]SHK31795.1 hypothetical protein SAMN02745194_04684 [Roseomonas rosea]